MKPLSLLFALFLHAVALGQGFTFRDASFVGSIGGGSGAGSPGGGGGEEGGEEAPPEPSEWWTMDETGSLDRVGAVHSTALVDMSAGDTADHAAGLYSNALKLTTGTAQAMRVTTSSTDLAYTTGDSVSFSWWTYFETSPATRIPLMELALKDGGDSDAGYIAVQMNSGGGSFAAWVWDNDAEYDEITTVPTLTTSTWHHWILTYDGGTELLQLTVDGTLVGTTSIPVTLPTSPKARLRIETGATAATTRWEEMGVWMNHKLTAGQITWLNNSGAGRTYPF
jgi:hypothetical protein